MAGTFWYLASPASRSASLASTLSAMTLAGTGTVTAAPWEIAGWTLTFHDEFEGTTLNRDVWGTVLPGESRTNGDSIEAYQDGDAWHVVNNSILRLVLDSSHNAGLIQSAATFSQMYGRFDARMKLPAGQGYWPAFWMRPLPYADGVFPEIDIFESLNADTSTLYFTQHWSTAYPNIGSSHGGEDSYTYSSGVNYASDFHVYSVEWSPSSVIWKIDGTTRFTSTSHVPTSGHGFTGMYLIFNFAVGGAWPGPPDGTTPYPGYFDIDYVRVYQPA
jgi:beta-glucanase (GH16 family)